MIGPDSVPVVTDAARAEESLELTVLSALSHGSGPCGEQVLKTAWSAFAAIGGDRSGLYADFLYEALPAAARSYLETLVKTGTFKPSSPWAREAIREAEEKAYADGIAKGEAAAILDVLSVRGIGVPEEAHARITSCADLDQLRQWVRRAVTADTVDELFD